MVASMPPWTCDQTSLCSSEDTSGGASSVWLTNRCSIPCLCDESLDRRHVAVKGPSSVVAVSDLPYFVAPW